MAERLNWSKASKNYLESRPERYPGALRPRVEWCQEVLEDRHLVKLEPDPKSRIGACRFIGFSAEAGRVLVVIAYRDLQGWLHLVNAWPASGVDLKLYERTR